MIADYFKYAFASLTRRKLRSWLTLIGILIGIASVVSLISLGEGLRAAITSQFGISSTEVITVQAGGLTGYGPPGTGVTNPITKDDAKAIERISSVKLTVTRNIVTLKMDFNDKQIIGYGTDVLDGEKRKFIYEQLEVGAEEGRLLKDGDTNVVVLGNNYLKDDTIFGKKVVVGNTVLVNDKPFKVVGIMEKKGSFILDNVILMNEKPLKDIANLGDAVSIIAVQVRDKELMNSAKEDIEKLLRKRRDVKKGEEDFQVSTPQAAMQSVNSILMGVQIFIVMIASISIFVGAIGIVNTMTTSVLERKKHIGVMKAIGAKNSDIFMQFFIESGLMGLIGGILGILLGVILGYFGTLGINNFVGADTLPKINFILIFGALLGSFIIGAIAGIVPAMKAAKQEPVEALRG